jgi:hypothetical protein
MLVSEDKQQGRCERYPEKEARVYSPKVNAETEHETS